MRLKGGNFVQPVLSNYPQLANHLTHSTTPLFCYRCGIAASQHQPVDIRTTVSSADSSTIDVDRHRTQYHLVWLLLSTMAVSMTK